MVLISLQQKIAVVPRCSFPQASLEYYKVIEKQNIFLAAATGEMILPSENPGMIPCHNSYSRENICKWTIQSTSFPSTYIYLSELTFFLNTLSKFIITVDSRKWLAEFWSSFST